MKARIYFTLGLFSIPGTALAGAPSEKAAAELLEKRMETERPEDLSILKAVEGKEIVVVRGTMDHIEQVLSAAKIRHTLINPNQVADYDLNADQILMVNCPGRIPKRGVQRVEKFVRAGGLLYTTDWTLKNLVESAFPGTIKHNGASTGNHVTPVHLDATHDDLMSNMILRKGQKPQWWLEGGSYPIKILDSKKVEVLASSADMKRRYKSAPVVVRFRWDDGEVIHVVSHFYRQMNAAGPAVAAKNAIDNVDGLTEAQKSEFKSSASGDVDMNNVESSYAFQQMTSNIVTTKKRRNKSLDKSYGYQNQKAISIDGRKVEPGRRIKVLKKKGKQAWVRDDRGNEGFVELDDLELR